MMWSDLSAASSCARRHAVGLISLVVGVVAVLSAHATADTPSNAQNKAVRYRCGMAFPVVNALFEDDRATRAAASSRASHQRVQRGVVAFAHVFALIHRHAQIAHPTVV